ncbi:NlpC/P60 family protein [Neptunomonas antarctica]|uniref:Probable lipoprotein NlpC n=1 Tax=Neptunomonas antarctica TaxID=619304 RepID=A0A1N7N9E4_9GAMM|nr:NlpC/P60 family protein [Neptunomonas antarctica]SIS94975.1 probable lipoprotein NlpC [Neptunomonas antarctica]
MKIQNICENANLFFYRSLSIVIVSGLLSGCVSNQPYHNPLVDRAYVPVKNQLQAHYSKWNGTPYKFGGASRQGVDCSAFVLMTYRDLFNVNLPRTTKAQARSGPEIPRQSVRPGDLVLFKTSMFNRHVGIYVGSEQFIHVSSSKGVTQSRLDNSYWSAKYWKAVRPSNLLLQ